MHLQCRGRRCVCRRQRLGWRSLVAFVDLVLHPPEEAVSVGRCGAQSTASFFAVLVKSAQQRSPLRCCHAVVVRSSKLICREDLPSAPKITMRALKKAARKLGVCSAAGPDGMPVVKTYLSRKCTRTSK
jgi:hypothetical protein